MSLVIGSVQPSLSSIAVTSITKSAAPPVGSVDSPAAFDAACTSGAATWPPAFLDEVLGSLCLWNPLCILHNLCIQITGG